MSSVEHSVEQKAVAEFMSAMGARTDSPFWISLIREESKEVLEAFTHLLKELADLCYVTEGFTMSEDFETSAADDESGEIEAAAKLMMLLGQIIPDAIVAEAFQRVHKSNMSKLGEDGKPIRRETDGKIMKGPNYRVPELGDLTIKVSNELQV